MVSPSREDTCAKPTHENSTGASGAMAVITTLHSHAAAAFM